MWTAWSICSLSRPRPPNSSPSRRFAYDARPGLSLSLTALAGLPEIQAGDDLAALIGDAAEAQGLGLREGDVLCVAQKIFSKAEGRVYPLSDFEPSAEARRWSEELGKDPRKVEAILRESRRVVRAIRHPGQPEGVMICEHRLGFVSANAAVDESNLGATEEERLMLLPEDPDASCARMAEALARRFSARIGVVMSDTFGRPWRIGQVNVAIGLALVPATLREQGNLDAWGRPLRVTSRLSPMRSPPPPGWWCARTRRLRRCCCAGCSGRPRLRPAPPTS